MGFRQPVPAPVDPASNIPWGYQYLWYTLCLVIKLLDDLLWFHQSAIGPLVLGTYVNGYFSFHDFMSENHSVRGDERMRGTREARFATMLPTTGIEASTTLFTFLGMISKWMMPPRPC